MPLLNIRETDLFGYVAEEVTTEKWFYACSARKVSHDEWNEIQRLTAQAIRLQGLLKEISSRPEIDLDDLTPEQRESCIVES